MRLGSLNIQLTGCILPGQDPRNRFKKECQDSIKWVYYNKSALGILADGHGDMGRPISNYICRYFNEYFVKKQGSFLVTLIQTNPEKAFGEMFKSCEESMKEELDCSVSGASVTAIYIKKRYVFVANVGDSRGIIAYCNKLLTCEPSSPKRKHTPTYPNDLQTIQITEDHRPDMPKEFDRILSMGGSVMQLEDSSGNKLGPYRVWKNEELPGLAMARSIGDLECSQVGVISTPTYQKVKLNSSHKFLVLGSDGVWDVMANSEVASLIESNRYKTARNIKKFSTKAKVLASKMCDMTAAHLVCEEARRRWLKLLREEDGVIDDISCLILELKQLEEQPDALVSEDESMIEFLRMEDKCE